MRFTNDTYVHRVSRAQDVLKEHGVHALLVGPSADLLYLTGFDAHSSERLVLYVLPADGEPTLILPALEAPLVGDAASRMTLHPWGDGDTPTVIAAEVINAPAGAALAVSNNLRAAFLLRLQERVDAAWQEADPLLRNLRMLKDADEVAALGEAARLTDEAWELFVKSGPVRGMTERQALAKLLSISGEMGLTGPYGIIGTGPNSASPHHSGNDRVIQPGDALVFDWGGLVDGYYSDVTRSAHVGEPEAEYRTVYETVKTANEAAYEAVKPGVPLQEVDRAARRVITGAGYGEFFTHRTGHGLGLDIHEEPFLVEGNTLPLAPGMTFSDEPGIYLPGRFGVRIEDTVVCTETGGQRLNNASRDLVIME